MIRVEVRKVPRRGMFVDEYFAVDDPSVFEYEVFKLRDFTLNR